MKFDQQYFQKHDFRAEQVQQYFSSAKRSLEIAQSEQSIPEVTFKFSYDALIKYAITLLALEGYKIRSSAGHHIKLLDFISEKLNDQDIADIGNLMRRHRNIDLYAGGIEITHKQCGEYLKFVEKIAQGATSILTQ